LGIGVADRVLMLENAYYSVISPEGCAAILWKHRSHAPEAAEALKLTASHLKELELIDEVVAEPLGGAHHDHELTSQNLKDSLLGHLRELCERPIDKLLNQRYEKFRRMGKVLET
jgi:acetyl-CoA carboxylase carboxyl transferase subunit alpha